MEGCASESKNVEKLRVRVYVCTCADQSALYSKENSTERSSRALCRAAHKSLCISDGKEFGRAFDRAVYKSTLQSRRQSIRQNGQAEQSKPLGRALGRVFDRAVGRAVEHLAESSTRASNGKVQERGWVEYLVKLFY